MMEVPYSIKTYTVHSIVEVKFKLINSNKYEVEVRQVRLHGRIFTIS